MNHLTKTIDFDQKIQVPITRNESSYLSLAINVAGIKCLIVGGGRVALRKARALLKSNAFLTIIAPDVCEELKRVIDNNKITWIKNKYSSKLVDEYEFIIAATSDKTLNIEIGKDAEQAGKLYCVVSSGQHSKVIFPAVYKQGYLNVAVHSNGMNCRYSKAVRNRIASLINHQDYGSHQFIMFGFERASLGRKDFRKLKEFEHSILKDNLMQDEVLILSTCCRWECYINSRSTRQLTRRILDDLKNILGLSWNQIREDIKYKSEHQACFHLLNTCLGLNSYLTGETEIVNQVRDSLSKWTLNEDSAMHKTFSSVLLAARKIRQSNLFIQKKYSWPRTIAGLVDKMIDKTDHEDVLVAGNGSLSKKIINKLINNNYNLINFSRHANRLEPGEYQIHHTDELGRFISNASILIICSELTPKAIKTLTDKRDRLNLFIIDLEGYSELFRTNNLNVKYFGLTDIPQQNISNYEVEKIAGIKLKTFEQALIWHAIQNPIKPPNEPIRVGARKSQLSKKQVQEIEYLLKALTDDIKLEKIFLDTPCDRDRKTPLPQVLEDDFFTYDIDQALLAGEIDLAVHSAKDLPQNLHLQLEIAAITPSLVQWDCLISKNDIPLMSLPVGATVATSSIKRRENLTRLRSDLKPVDVRGNVPDRIRQLDEGKFDALIVAAVGLIRLGLTDRITEVFSTKDFPNTPGQASLALVVRRSDIELLNFLKPFDLGRETLL